MHMFGLFYIGWYKPNTIPVAKAKKTKNKGDTYDELFRDNVFNIILPVAEDLLDLKIDNPVPFLTDIVRISKREPDYVGKFEEKPGQEALLHVELQSNDDPRMVHRMREYQCLYEGRFELPMHQYCIYLGQKPSKMATHLRQRIPNAHNNYSYKLIELRNYSSRLFLNSNTPEMVLLAILGNYGGETPEAIISKILGKLQQLAGNLTLLEKYVNQLNTLSKLRNLQEQTIEQIKAMPIHFDIKKDVLYQEGIERGIEQGVMAMLKGGKHTTVEIAHLMQLTVEQVTAIKEKYGL